MIKPMEGTTLNLTGKIAPASVECFTLAREEEPPAKDPPNSHTYIHPSIQAYT